MIVYSFTKSLIGTEPNGLSPRASSVPDVSALVLQIENCEKLWFYEYEKLAMIFAYCDLSHNSCAKEKLPPQCDPASAAALSKMTPFSDRQVISHIHSHSTQSSVN
jgi:hypothetical protein